MSLCLCYNEQHIYIYIYICIYIYIQIYIYIYIYIDMFLENRSAYMYIRKFFQIDNSFHTVIVARFPGRHLQLQGLGKCFVVAFALNPKPYISLYPDSTPASGRKGSRAPFNPRARTQIMSSLKPEAPHTYVCAHPPPPPPMDQPRNENGRQTQSKVTYAGVEP